MIDAFWWWLTATVVGLAFLPYSYRFFRFLPDRGIALARPLGLLLVGYVLWLGAFSGALPNTGGSAVLLVVLLAAGGLWLAGRDRASLVPELRARLWYIVAVEAVFLLFFAGAAVLRAPGLGQQAVDVWEQFDAVVPLRLPRQRGISDAVKGERDARVVVGGIDT